MRWFKEEIDLILIIGVFLIIIGLGLTVFKEDKAEDMLQKVVIKLPNDEIVTGEVAEWTTYDNKDTVKVKLKNGKQYLGHSSDIVLYND
uniref:SCIMP protein n=1 Tax=Siphoviridae sp. cti6f5 TaxID=2826430 RepID=A0A8S5MCT5_9CAUD|nr:MAG TPA: SCIMP protein [Siphoviridae sp. cti6f5]